MGAVFSLILGSNQDRNALPAPQSPSAADEITEHVQAVVETNGALSKRARKRIEREKKFQERKKKRKEAMKASKIQKKLEKRTEREERLRHLTDAQREEHFKERQQIMRANRLKMKEERMQVRKAIEEDCKYNICIDLGWNAHMYDNEKKSLCRQLAYAYNALRKGVEGKLTPVSLSITGVDDIIKPFMTTTASGWESWPLRMTDKQVDEVYPKSRLVYLTHDSDCILQQLNPDDVYIIGGIVDRNRLKNATKNKADQLKIRTARFDLDSHLSLSHGTPVLTVNHCLEIMLYVANGISWSDAFFKVLPTRKGVLSSAPASTTQSLKGPQVVK